ncbi:AraC family transcriptional regulator [Isoalcanivorax beigongshangi]|uniref:AraC family transcriptional regulator n=1 Tax=Isoalcanivorax beigongshangi TaxID=3238810 RepID=A0ABV4AFZ3_9GAMM
MNHPGLPAWAETSNWPLTGHGERILLPPELLQALSHHPLSQGLHPLAMGFYPAALGHQMRRPSPADHLVIYCVEGEGWYDTGAHQGTVSAGDLLVLPAGRPHAYGARGESPWSLYWVHLGGPLAARQMAELDPDAASCLGLGLNEQMVQYFHQLLEHTRATTQIDAFLFAAHLCRTLLSYATLLRRRPPAGPRGIDVEALHRYMQAHLDQRLTLEDLAAAAGIESRYQFIRQYRAQTGETPVKAFLRMKVARACYLLDTSDATVADVAAACGFDDPYYFSRVFRSTTGTSPSRYRQRD